MNKEVRETLIAQFEEILDCLVANYNFDKVIFSNKYSDISEWERYYSRDTKNIGVEVTYGCTKIVVIPNEGEWVLKVPINYEKEDFCKIEVENYKKAKRNDLGDFFCEAHFLMNYYNAPCYIMRRAQVDESNLFSDVRRYMSSEGFTEEEIEDKMYDLDDDDILYDFFCSYYQVDFVDKLMSFLSKEKINDIHSENMGYYGDRPIIFDYSGYFS